MKIQSNNVLIDFDDEITFTLYYKDKVVGYFKHIDSAIKAIIYNKKLKIDKKFLRDFINKYVEIKENSMKFYSPIQNCLDTAYSEKFNFSKNASLEVQELDN